jgi:hypothetical protein
MLLEGHGFSYKFHGISFMTTVSYKGLNLDSSKKAGGSSSALGKGSDSPSVTWGESFIFPRHGKDKINEYGDESNNHIVFAGYNFCWANQFAFITSFLFSRFTVYYAESISPNSEYYFFGQTYVNAENRKASWLPLLNENWENDFERG